MNSNVVVFGVRKRYILCAGTTATYADLPGPVTAHLDRANDLHHFTTCAFGLSRDSYFISYRTKSGQDRTFFNCLPTKLTRWLAPNGLVVGRDLDTLQLSIGCNNSFYAADDKGVCYDGLPLMLAMKLGVLGVQDGGVGRNVAWVALGVAATWAVVDLQGRVWENLENRYEGLRVYLEKQQEVGDVVERIFLDAIRGDRYAVCADNTWHYDLTGCDISPYSSIVSTSKALEKHISYDSDGSNEAQDGWEIEDFSTARTSA